ncbi:MAG: hypothetical protein JNJ83_04860 [Verrucomicrobiaceae bacterium]|nr:hypothetical protein [Verrucomicrobiaceae bacterium]
MYSPIHLVFYLLTLLLPADVTEFTVTAKHGDQKLQATWTKTDKGWRGKTESGDDMGLWSVPSPLTVLTINPDGTSSNTSFKGLLVTKDVGGDKPKSFIMAGDPVEVVRKDGSISFKVPDYDHALVATFTTKKSGPNP